VTIRRAKQTHQVSPRPGGRARPLRPSSMTPVGLARPSQCEVHPRRALAKANATSPWHARNRRHTRTHRQPSLASANSACARKANSHPTPHAPLLPRHAVLVRAADFDVHALALWLPKRPRARRTRVRGRVRCLTRPFPRHGSSASKRAVGGTESLIARRAGGNLSSFFFLAGGLLLIGEHGWC
jgi:hypothetical protein